MKLEREPLFGHITLSHKPDSKSFDYDELSLDSNGVKSGKVVKETQNGHSHDFKDTKNDDGQLLYLMNDGNSIASSKLDCLDETENVNSYKDCHQSEDIVAPFTESSPEIESLRNDPDFYADKSAIECEMPELQVCYRDSNYSSVKDICVDDGVQSKDKLVFEDSADKKSLCTFVFPDQDLDKKLQGERDIAIFSANGFKSSSENISDTDFVCVTKDLTPTSQVDCDTEEKLGNDILQQTGIITLTEETEADNPHFGTPVLEESEVPPVQISSDNASEDTTRTIITGPESDSEKLDSNREEASAITAPPNSTAEEPRISSAAIALMITTGPESDSEKLDSNREEASAITAPPNSTAEEPRISSAAIELPYISKVEKRRITFNFDSSTPEITTKEAPQNDDSERLETDDGARAPVCNRTTDKDKTLDSEIASEPEIEERSQTGVSGSSESPRTSSVDCEPQNQTTDSGHVHKPPEKSTAEDGLPGSQFVSGHFQFGESSFSAAGPLSGRITYSGPIPYSGSISVRSDSSTTSTRSFAFPVLQNEWNSSPVRMAKAERRRFRKNRGWRHGILCCRF